MYQVDATARALEGLTLNNPAQARKGAVWGHATRVLACVPEARALNPSVFEEFKSASLRDAFAHIWAYPTLRFERGCSLRSLPHACAGLLRGSASGTISSHHLVLDATARAPEGLTEPRRGSLSITPHKPVRAQCGGRRHVTTAACRRHALSIHQSLKSLRARLSETLSRTS